MKHRQSNGDLGSIVTGSTDCPVLILNFNGWDDTLAGLNSMASHVSNLWLIDNGSSVDRTQEVRLLHPKVRIISTGANLGWAGGYNHAIRLATAEGHKAVYILNNDAVLREGALPRALRTLWSAPDLAVVGSMMLDNGGTHAFFDGDWHWEKDVGAARLREDVREVRSIHGGGFVLNLAAFHHVGPFHEEYFLYHEETDWCLRAKVAGWRVLVDCQSRVDHEGEGSNVNFNRSYYLARNRFQAKQRGILLRECEESCASIFEYEIIGAVGKSLAERVAIINGLLDGARGRFGQRRANCPKLASVPFAIIMPVVFRARRKMNFLLGAS